MTLGFVLILLACIFMWIAAFNPTRTTDGRWTLSINFMCLSFALIITAWLVGGVTWRG